jgi:hypothetical protein
MEKQKVRTPISRKLNKRRRREVGEKMRQAMQTRPDWHSGNYSGHSIKQFLKALFK